MSARRQSRWDRAARGYARQEPLERQAIGVALSLAAPGLDEALLDVATGTGLVLRELAGKRVRPRRAVGIDASESMLARVGPLPAGWSARHGDATAIPFADASFDVAIAAYVLHVLSPPERSAALAELHRVVRPGGRLVTVTIWSSRPACRAVLANAARAAPDTLTGLRPHDPRGELAPAGWLPTRAHLLRHGYPSLVVLARRAR